MTKPFETIEWKDQHGSTASLFVSDNYGTARLCITVFREGKSVLIDVPESETREVYRQLKERFENDNPNLAA